MIVFGYAPKAATVVDSKFSTSILYIMDGTLPTEADPRQTSAEFGEQLYNECLGFIELQCSIPANRPESVIFFQHPNSVDVDITTKGWNTNHDGKIYCYPDEVDLSESNIVRNPGYHQLGLANVQSMVTPHNPTSSLEGKKIIHRFNQPISVDKIYKATTSTNRNTLYYKDGNSWVEIITLLSADNETTFPEVTANEFMLHIYYRDASPCWFCLGHSSTLGINSGIRTPTHGILTSTVVSDTNWEDHSGSDLPSFTFATGVIGQDKPLILDKNSYAKGSKIALLSLDITFQEIGDDFI